MTQLYSVRSRRSWGVGRPGRPGRAGRLERRTTSAPTSSWSTRCTRPSRCRRWSPRPTCRPPGGSSTRSTCGSRTSPRSATLPPPSAQLLEWHADDAHALNTDGRRSTATPPGRPSGGPARPSSHQPRAPRPRARVRRLRRRARARGWSTSRPGARWPRSTDCPGATGPSELHDPPQPGRRRRRARTWPTGSTFHQWLQWLRRRAARRGAADGAATPGWRSGSIHDLAVGVHPEGADAWALRDALARGVDGRAPRRTRSTSMGQDWSQPPWRPDRLAGAGLRAVPRHAAHRPAARRRHPGRPRHRPVPAVVGARAGCPPTQGTYVRYDHEALVGILALEAHRAGAVVVGEDLGVGRAVGARLPARARDPRHLDPVVREGRRRAGRCRRSAGASCAWPRSPRTTCRRPPATSPASTSTCASELGLLTRPRRGGAAADDAEREAGAGDAARARAAAAPAAPSATMVEALHRFLTWTPARLLGVSRWPTRSGDRRAITSPAPTRSTRTGGCRWPTAGRHAGAARGPDGLALGPPAGPHRRASADGTRRRTRRTRPSRRGSGGPVAWLAPVSRGRRPAPGRRSARATPSRFSVTRRRRPAGASACASSQPCVASASSRLGQQRRVDSPTTISGRSRCVRVGPDVRAARRSSGSTYGASSCAVVRAAEAR